VYLFLRETKPQPRADAKPETVGATFKGYGRVLRDTTFMLFVFMCILMGLVYMNMNTTLGVYLRDVHHVQELGYGLLLSINALMVVVLQFPISHAITDRPPLLMMAAGTALYAVGFAMYGLVSGNVMFILAMVIITFGEMIVSPVAQALVARFAPEDMRGRYMAIFGISWSIPFMIGPLLAGLILDNLNPNLLWYSAGFIGLLAVLGFLYLHRRARLVEATPELSEA